MKNRLFVDRDYLQTLEDFIFCVIGYVHPRGKVFAYLKYIPTTHGKWGREQTYDRIFKFYTIENLNKTLKFLEENCKCYIFRSKLLNLKFSAVPKSLIKHHYKPREKLKALYRQDELDNLQMKTLRLIEIISEYSDVPKRYFGITGSLLLGIHKEFSDIDLTVYGRKSSMKVKESIKSLFDEKIIQKAEFNMSNRAIYNRARAGILSANGIKQLSARRWNRGIYENTFFSIHPVKLDYEINEKYGDKSCRPVGFAKIYAEVEDASEAIFLPAVYKVKNVQFVEGVKKKNLREIVVYEGLFADLASENEKIIAYGKLEEVTDRRHDDFYSRLVIGSLEAKDSDYILPV